MREEVRTSFASYFFFIPVRKLLTILLSDSSTSQKGFANKAWPKAFYPTKLLFHVTRLVQHEDAWGEQKHSLLVNNPVILPWQAKKLLYRSQLIIKMTSSNIIAKDPGVSD